MPNNEHSQAAAFRIGHGFDLHRLEPLPPAGRGRPLRLGGVEINAGRGPVAHSDGDVLLHALTDAVLGAVALPDIGQLFPNDDPLHEGADSAPFLEEAVNRANKMGWHVANADCTVVLQTPKVGPHKDRIRTSVARMLRTPLDAVNVKGKTHERVDATGRGEAVQVHAVVLLQRRTGAERG